MTAATIVFLHGLGASRRALDPVAALLPDRRVIGIDLPGHGDSAVRDGRLVGETAHAVATAIASVDLGPYVLVGHSMGGKIATMTAALARGGAGPSPEAVVLLAPSPPTPEPMDEERRERMLSWVADGQPLSDEQAREFVSENVGAPLAEVDEQRALDDLRQTSPTAWRLWLELGSREDVARDVGALELPAVIIGGTADADLGATAQPRLHGAVYPRARFIALAGAGHLLASERAREVAHAIAQAMDQPGA